MPKKKQPRNPFFFFMLDYKARCERNGDKFPNGLRDVQLEAGPEWDAMPASEKKYYEDMAKEEKLRLKGDSSQKETCWHTSYVSIERQKHDEEYLKNSMNDYIENLVRSLASKKLLAEYKFYLIHVNYFCISEGECYHPAELAVAEFSLGEGVTNTYHTIMDPGLIPLGYRHDAMQKSESSHKIPIESNGGEREFYKILQNIQKFIEPGRNFNGGEYPPMFTMPDNVILNTSTTAVKSVIETLCSTLPVNEDHRKFPIYSLEKLFFELQKACSMMSQKSEDDCDETSFSSISIARHELEKDVFNSSPHIACQFHHQEDAVEYCSKSFVQRWVYLMCDHCCQFLNIQMRVGYHLPTNADVNYKPELPEENLVAQRTKTWVVNPKAQAASTWVPVEQVPLPRPRVQPNLAALLPKQQPTFDASEANFPSIPVGRGRGKPVGNSSGRGSSALSFAEAMGNKR